MRRQLRSSKTKPIQSQQEPAQKVSEKKTTTPKIFPLTEIPAQVTTGHLLEFLNNRDREVFALVNKRFAAIVRKFNPIQVKKNLDGLVRLIMSDHELKIWYEKTYRWEVEVKCNPLFRVLDSYHDKNNPAGTFSIELDTISRDVALSVFKTLLADCKAKFIEHINKEFSHDMINQMHIKFMCTMSRRSASQFFAPAIMAGDKDLVISLMAYGADVKVDERIDESAPWAKAIDTDNLELSQIMLTQPESVSLSTALYYACAKGKIKIINFLVGLKTDPNFVSEDKGRTPLMAAVINHQMLAIKALFESGKIDLTIQDRHGYTALMYSAQNNNHQIANFLILNGDDPGFFSSKAGLSPIHVAVKHKSLTVLRLFQEVNISSESFSDPNRFKLNMNIFDAQGNTPILLATKLNHSEESKVLISNERVHLNVQDANNNTPLMWILKNKNLGLLCVLLEEIQARGDYLSLELVNNDFHTPSEYAEKFFPKGLELIIATISHRDWENETRLRRYRVISEKSKTPEDELMSLLQDYQQEVKKRKTTLGRPMALVNKMINELKKNDIDSITCVYYIKERIEKLAQEDKQGKFQEIQELIRYVCTNNKSPRHSLIMSLPPKSFRTIKQDHKHILISELNIPISSATNFTTFYKETMLTLKNMTTPRKEESKRNFQSTSQSKSKEITRNTNEKEIKELKILETKQLEKIFHTHLDNYKKAKSSSDLRYTAIEEIEALFNEIKKCDTPDREVILGFMIFKRDEAIEQHVSQLFTWKDRPKLAQLIDTILKEALNMELNTQIEKAYKEKYFSYRHANPDKSVIKIWKHWS